MGKEVTVFCTFYGLNLLLKDLSHLRISPQGNPDMPMKMPFGPKWFQAIDFGPKIPNLLWNIPGLELFRYPNDEERPLKIMAWQLLKSSEKFVLIWE